MAPTRSRSAALKLLDLEPRAPVVVPAEVAALLAEAARRIDAFFEMWKDSRSVGFFPSEYEMVYGALKVLKESYPQLQRLCEWGSGFGVVAALGVSLGYEACGIEIDPRLVTASRKLLEDHDFDVAILQGSFVPESYAARVRNFDGDTGTVLWGPGAVDEVDVAIRDFDVIYAFPWPDEEEMYHDLFARFASVGAVLVTYSGLEGVRARRKMA